MELKVNPNRMELLKLKKRLSVAQRGHRLLQDKQEELMHELMRLIKDAKNLRFEVEEEVLEVYRSINSARLYFLKEENSLVTTGVKGALDISVSTKRIMNIRIPKLKLESLPAISYSLIDTSPDLDIGLKRLYAIFKRIIELAELEESIAILSEEIERTRRRVNALEYILIPKILSAIKDINMRLSEMERSNLTRLMRVKEIVRAH